MLSLSVSPEDKLEEVYGRVLTKVIDTYFPSFRIGLIDSYSMNKERSGYPSCRRNIVKQGKL